MNMKVWFYSRAHYCSLHAVIEHFPILLNLHLIRLFMPCISLPPLHFSEVAAIPYSHAYIIEYAPKSKMNNFIPDGHYIEYHVIGLQRSSSSMHF